MSSPLRSEGWRNRASAGPNFDTLLLDDAALTLLAGTVAFQIPLTLATSMTVSAHGVLRLAFTPYGPLRLLGPKDDEAKALLQRLRSAGAKTRSNTLSKRPLAILAATVIAVTVPLSLLSSEASLHTAQITEGLLRLRDMPPGFEVRSSGVMPIFFPSPNRVVVPTTTTTPKHQKPGDREWAREQTAFESCVGTTHRSDRTVGLAAQPPEVYASSSTFGSAASGDGMVVGSMVQWYASVDNVRRDTEQMRRPKFATCFAAMYAQSYLFMTTQSKSGAVISPTTLVAPIFTSTFHREGTVSVRVPGERQPLYFTVSVVTTGHYEATVLFISASLNGVADVVRSIVATQSGRISGGAVAAA